MTMLSGRIRPYHSASPEVVCFRVRAPWRARRRGPWPLLSSRSRRLGPGPVIGWLCSLLCTHRVVMSVSPLSENDWHEPRKAAHLTTHQDGARIQGYARTPNNHQPGGGAWGGCTRCRKLLANPPRVAPTQHCSLRCNQAPRPGSTSRGSATTCWSRTTNRVSSGAGTTRRHPAQVRMHRSDLTAQG